VTRPAGLDRYRDRVVTHGGGGRGSAQGAGCIRPSCGQGGPVAIGVSALGERVSVLKR
jgi:hypothetical protein